jgi:NAD+ diphosphatase
MSTVDLRSPQFAAQDEQLWIVVRDAEVLVAETDGVLSLPPSILARPWVESADGHIRLGRFAEREYYAVAASAAGEPASSLRFASARSLFGILDEVTLSFVGKALALTEFEATHRFCGRCATPTEASALERARHCPHCRATFYPRIPPAVITLIERDDRILLARSARFKNGVFSAVAGFVETGESLEDAVAREVKEEVGVEIDQLRYFGSQPWPFRSLMIAFFARYRAGEIAVDDEEIVEAAWFEFNRLPPLPPSISIARKLIDSFVARQGSGGLRT